MRCGALDAHECATGHWCWKLPNAHREPTEWRADCPACGAERAVWWKPYGRGMSWGSYCGEHSKEALRPILAGLLSGCLAPVRRSRVIDPADIKALGRSDLNTVALKVALLQLTGMTATEALDELGVTRTNRYRILRELSHWRYKTAGR